MKMPNKYQRKSITLRGNWSELSLKAAINAVKHDHVSVYAAAKTYGIPRKTLERRLKTNNDKKGPMGPSSFFGEENERKLAKHIKIMQARGFPLTVDDLRRIAYQFAEQLQLKHRFNKTKQKAGYDFVQLFLSRHPDVVLRKSEGVSVARSKAMNKTEIDAYFNLLEESLKVNGEMLAGSHIFNMDETGLQLNNRPGHVLAEKGSKAVSTVTSTEKGETITVIGCCSAEGTFLPPSCIMKGKNKKAEFEDGLPPGSKVFMSPKSAYITSEIFLEWLKTHFVARKPPGKVLLLLDGHATHCNSVEMLEYAEENDIILISMPSHTSHWLQPLDRAVFKSLKTHFYEQCRLWLNQNASRRITRLSFGSLLNKAWGKAASAENAISGFRATGVCPLNPDAIPDYAFAADTQSSSNPQQATSSIQEQASSSGTGSKSTNLAKKIRGPEKQKRESISETIVLSETEQPICEKKRQMLNSSPEIVPKKKPKKIVSNNSQDILMIPGATETPKKLNDDKTDFTPSRILQEISSVPQQVTEVRKRAKQVATLLTSEEHILKRKLKEEEKAAKLLKTISKKAKKEDKTEVKENKTIKEDNKIEKKIINSEKKQKKTEHDQKQITKSVPRKRKSLRRISETSDDDDELVLCDASGEDDGGREEDNCLGCGENYFETHLIEDWLQCIVCDLWVHENCTEFDDMCSKCGNTKKKVQRLAKYDMKKEK